MHRHGHAVPWHGHHRMGRRSAIATPVEDVYAAWDQLHPRDAPTATDGCSADNTSALCEKPAGASSKLPMILGAAIPILAAVVVLFFLHQRHMRRLRIEEQMDKTKSMDFGMGPAHVSRKAALHAGEKGHDSRSRRQMSVDMDTVVAPYLMPLGANDSRESLARTVHSIDDRYGRPPPSPRSRELGRDPSIYRHDASPDGTRSNMEVGLLDGAQRMATSTPPPARSPLPSPSIPHINLPTVPPRAKTPDGPHGSRDSYQGRSQDAAPIPKIALPSILQPGGASPRSGSPFDDPVSTPSHAARPVSNDESVYGHDEGIQFRFSNASVSVADPEELKKPQPKPQQNNDRKSLAPAAFDGRRLSMGFRPLPPDANPDDTAEERAMRIRSFYKEYFSADDSANAPAVPQIPAHYQDDYSQEFSAGFDDTTVFDSETGRFIVPGAKPFAEPVTRRAMTPPPRAPPRFMGPAAHGLGQGPRSRADSAAGGHFMPPPGSRSFSSASGRVPGPRKPIEPPKPLMMMPTPSMLKEDAFASPHMFAPPVHIHRSESDTNELRGGLRPYSPGVAPHIPLASAFEELPAMPSPHMLRKSAAFTALDFAPPRKFKNENDMSDAGSIHSNHTGISALQQQNIRSGAYRVSRIPTDVVPLKDDMTAGLKPTWDLGYGKSS
ncbi:hypothetical protein FN846DRAFT_969505 [Sphaerosporella brunnea]|uniref:Uncharacterized protein n=1 Tax=Sphaerosporella brunnea TaxID=1250544 RepID=A0A5J5EIC6_9PEZI|nr:hypothetical protein FN846DRAFT_969505 [Sphaerosporella brunnea]